MKLSISRLPFFSLLLFLAIACQTAKKEKVNDEIMASLGTKYKSSFSKTRDGFKLALQDDSTNINNLLGYAEANVYLYIFGYSSRNETFPLANKAVQRAVLLDSLNSEVQRLQGIISFLDWDWHCSKQALLKSIKINPTNLSSRHWYSLYLSAMGKTDEAMAQSDTIMTMDAEASYLVGRGSLLYFQQRFAELEDLMLEAVAKDTTVPWAYDWLGMAYNGLGQHEKSIKTYYKAFNLSDGTVEIGAGLGHALAEAGEIDEAQHMADFYALKSKDNYLPSVQRSFIHIGLGEYDEALNLLEQAYDEKSWFLIFVQIEPWYNPIRGEKRFKQIMRKMDFPQFNIK